MKHSPEAYQEVAGNLDQARKADKIMERAIRIFKHRGDEEGARLLEYMNMHRTGRGESAEAIKQRLRAMMDQGHTEANQLNATYSELTRAVVEAENELLQFSEEQDGELELQSPEFIKIAERINQAVAQLQVFKRKKLGIEDETKPLETAILG